MAEKKPSNDKFALPLDEVKLDQQIAAEEFQVEAKDSSFTAEDKPLTTTALEASVDDVPREATDGFVKPTFPDQLIPRQITLNSIWEEGYDIKEIIAAQQAEKAEKVRKRAAAAEAEKKRKQSAAADMPHKRRRLEKELPTFDYEQFLEKVGANRDEWDQLGNIFFNRFFEFLFKEGVGYGEGLYPIQLDDTRRQVDLKEDNVWIMYNLTQQLIRQYPLHYMLHVALRPDHNRRLIAYPHCKQDRLDPRAPFRTECTETLSADDNEDGVCLSSILLLGKNPDDKYVRYTKGPKPPYQLNSGALRIAWHSIPYGTLKPCIRCLHQPIPTYVGIADDHMTLNYINMGTWDDVKDAHRNCTPAPMSGCERWPRDGKRPASDIVVPVHGISALSDALIGRRRFDDLEVIREMKRWFRPHSDEKWFWYEKARVVMEKAWEQVKAVEKRRKEKKERYEAKREQRRAYRR